MGTLTHLHIRPIESEEERLQVYEEAEKDGDRHPLMPTHVVMKYDDIVGVFCLYGVSLFDPPYSYFSIVGAIISAIALMLLIN